MKMMIWNTSLYQGFSFQFEYGKSFDFSREMENKIVIILNNSFENDKNEIKWNIDLVPTNDIFLGARKKNISTLIIGDKNLYADQGPHLMDSSPIIQSSETIS